MNDDPKQSLAVAGGAISSALIDLLVESEVISREDALIILGKAQAQCLAVSDTGAAHVVGVLYSQYLPRN